jgi:hypothetical protein
METDNGVHAAASQSVVSIFVHVPKIGDLSRLIHVMVALLDNHIERLSRYMKNVKDRLEVKHHITTVTKIAGFN